MHDKTVFRLNIGGTSKVRRAMVFAVAACVLIAVFLLIASGASLSRDQLKLSAHTLHGSWHGKGIFFDDKFSWNGSAGVIRTDGGKIWLFTNLHCLALSELAESRWIRTVHVVDYRLTVEFASGKEKHVLRFGDQVGDLDLALIEVDGEGLVEGLDYVIIPYKQGISVDRGDDVVAVGSPFGLSQTETFGKVSALRDHGPSGEACHIIQIDAAVNPGNSGGPLFKKDGRKYYWIGVNSWKITEAQGLNFAVAASELESSRFRWYSADKAGAAAALVKEYHKSAEPAE
jgi:hypothetical protein